MYDKLSEYLMNRGMQPGALDRLIQKMEQVRGTKPMFSGRQTGFRGNQSALRGRNAGLQLPVQRPW